MKKRLAMGGVIGALLALLAIGTAAYFTTSQHVTNVITTGTVEMTLTETGEGENITDGAGNVTGMSFTGVMPGQVVSKEPVITNTGSEMFYTRVKVDVSIEPAVAGAQVDTALVHPDIDGETWLKGSDGWYYYNSALEPGKSVTLFETVTFDRSMGNDYQNCTVTMNLQAQAVQAKNNPVPLTGTVLDVKGWPGTVPAPTATPAPTVSPAGGGE